MPAFGRFCLGTHFPVVLRPNCRRLMRNPDATKITHFGQFAGDLARTPNSTIWSVIIKVENIDERVKMSRFVAHCICSVGLVLTTTHSVAANASFDFYGHLNFGLFNTDDGFDEETYFTDNDNSNTRVGFNWINEFSADRSLRFNFETGVGLNGSSAVTIDDTDLDFDWDKTDLRKFEFIYKVSNFGTFSFGQGSTASDGVAEADFSGTNVIAYSGIADLAGSIEFRASDGSASGLDIGDVFKSFDGARRFRVRYDTPSIHGVSFSVSGGEEILADGDENEYYDAAARYAADYGEIRTDVRVGYGWVSGGQDVLSGSLATLHEPTGLSLAISSGAEQSKGDAEFVYVKLGWQQNWFSAGTTALSLDYNDGNDFEFNGTESTSASFAIVQKLDAQSLEVYAVWRTFELEAPGSSFEDIDVFAIGARWKF